MKHLLAYANSDQASFRDRRVRDSFDIVTVPGTIAAYYADATAAFVLSSELDYLIEPRTPLFQEHIDLPRASHLALAAQLCDELRSAVEDGATNLGPAFFNEQVSAEMAERFVAFQRQYSGRASAITERIDRYRGLLAEARGETPASSSTQEVRGPTFVLTPYFAVREVDDAWWGCNQAIWRRCADLDNPEAISPVLAVASVDQLGPAIEARPPTLSDTVFFWVAGFDERSMDVGQLATMWRTVENRSSNARLINLYGGFYSVCLSKAGLWAFNNGLGYSESRGWPELAATGAAPARYYLRALHTYLPVRTAQALVDSDPALGCPCVVCAETNGRIDELSYQQLKAHFALARAWELQIVDAHSREELGAHMLDNAALAESAALLLPRRLRPPTEHLHRWAAVVSGQVGEG